MHYYVPPRPPTLGEQGAQVLFFDKDRTLGEYEHPTFHLYPGVPELVQAQRRQGRKLFVVTTAETLATQDQLQALSPAFSGIYGFETINSAYTHWYLSSFGTPRQRDDDYEHYPNATLAARAYWFAVVDAQTGKEPPPHHCRRIDSLPASEQENINLELRADFADKSSWRFWHQFIDKETGVPVPRRYVSRFSRLSLGEQEIVKELLSRPVQSSYEEGLFHRDGAFRFDRESTYQNPYSPDGFLKDLLLARRHVSYRDFDRLHAVLIGDTTEESVAPSDPQTPVVVISDRNRAGDWVSMATITDHLFASTDYPWEVYDRLFASARHKRGGKDVSLERHRFLLRRGEHDSRIVVCP